MIGWSALLEWNGEHRTARHDASLGADASAQRGQQARLADAGLAREQHDLARPAGASA